jgi:hypothetical protein
LSDVHAAFQLVWAAAMLGPLVLAVARLLADPLLGRVPLVLALSAGWALVALVAWAIRVAALSGAGAFGHRTRDRAGRVDVKR